MANWTIDKSDGSYRILDPSGQERGRFADADTLAVHLAGCMEELDKLQEAAKPVRQMYWKDRVDCHDFVGNKVMGHLAYRLRDSYGGVESMINRRVLGEVAIAATIESKVVLPAFLAAQKKINDYRDRLAHAMVDGDRKMVREAELRDMALALLLEKSPGVELPKELASVRDMHYASGKWR